MFTKDPENRTFRITLLTTAPGELQCSSEFPNLLEDAITKKNESHAPYVRLSISLMVVLSFLTSHKFPSGLRR